MYLHFYLLNMCNMWIRCNLKIHCLIAWLFLHIILMAVGVLRLRIFKILYSLCTYSTVFCQHFKTIFHSKHFYLESIYMSWMCTVSVLTLIMCCISSLHFLLLFSMHLEIPRVFFISFILTQLKVILFLNKDSKWSYSVMWNGAKLVYRNGSLLVK